MRASWGHYTRVTCATIKKLSAIRIHPMIENLHQVKCPVHYDRKPNDPPVGAVIFLSLYLICLYRVIFRCENKDIAHLNVNRMRHIFDMLTPALKTIKCLFYRKQF